ncbi:MAG: hypothetical protein KTR30_03140 [Saprospiraceae bacterium]|nr:hypothetical protein [Saprospiraceae bacterium]
MAVACQSQKVPEKSTVGPFVILKLDDLWYEDELVHPGWLQAIEFLQEQEVVGTVGLVGKSLEAAAPEYYDWIKQRAGEGFEFWNHGYCHCKPVVEGEERREFRGTDFGFQLEQLSKTQSLAKEKLGMTLRSFGAPYNATDDSTALALATIPELEVWMYKETIVPTTKFLLDRIQPVNIEYPVHIPDFDKFKKGYEAYKEEEVLVLQGHPRSWVDDSARFVAFQQIILFLKAEQAQFITPYAYYLQTREEKQS